MSDKKIKEDSGLTAANTTTLAIPDDYDSGIKKEDVKTPSILLYQKMSEMAEFEDTDVKPGDLVCPVSGDVLGKSIHGAVIKMYITVREYGEADDSGRKEILRFSQDGVNWSNGDRIQPSEFAWRGDKPPVALKSYHYLVMVKELRNKGFMLPTIVTFKGASAKYAKTLNANLLYARPAWRNWVKFFSAVEEKNGNKYHILQSKSTPKDLVPKDLGQECYDVYMSYKSQSITSTEMDSSDTFDGNDVDFDAK